MVEEDEPRNRAASPRRRRRRTPSHPRRRSPPPPEVPAVPPAPFAIPPVPQPVINHPAVLQRGHRTHADPDVGPLDLPRTKDGNIALLRLHQATQIVVRYSFLYIEGSVVGLSGYPDALPSKKIEFLARALRKGAEVMGAPQELQNALRRDINFILSLSELVSALFQPLVF